MRTIFSQNGTKAFALLAFVLTTGTIGPKNLWAQTPSDTSEKKPVGENSHQPNDNTNTDQGNKSSENDEYRYDSHGHPFKVRFNPFQRISVGAAVPVYSTTHPGFVGTELHSSIVYRSYWRWGEGPGLVSWQLEHNFTHGWVRPGEIRQLPTGDATIYSVSGLRHDESPKAVLPTSPPVGIPFPFDYGFDADVGRFMAPLGEARSQTSNANIPIARISPIRVSIFLDPWRSGHPGRSFEIGVGTRYEMELIDPQRNNNWRTNIHRVAPMTASHIRFRWQDKPGLTWIDLRGEIAPHWTSEQRWATLFMSQAHIERTIAAINDQPINFWVDSSVRHTPESRELKEFTEARVALGLSLGFNL